MPRAKLVVIPDNLERRIHLIRDQKVILDLDLAELYGVKTKVLNQAIKRNRERFPQRFMFRLTVTEKKEVVTNCDHLRELKFSPVTPFAFTEHGALMAATILNSPRAIHMSIHLIEAFVRLRALVADRQELLGKLSAIEKTVASHEVEIRQVFETLERLLAPPVEKRREIGFHTQLRTRQAPKKTKPRVPTR
ncbi:MAG: ORF6N domain-containing protein [Pedosphaera sp.]|nr:ORF6N domain-containing protein [Pedosphaera sp.]